MEKKDCTPNGMPMYVLVNDGNNRVHKIVNFDNPEMVEFKGSVIVKSLRTSSRHQPSVTHTVWKDPVTDIIWGIPNGIDPHTKDLKFQPIEINDMKIFELSIAQERKQWAVISKASFWVGSPNRGAYKPSHEIVNVERDAQTKILKANLRSKNHDIISNLSPLQVMDMARNCGSGDIKNNSSIVVLSELYDWADKHPDEFAKIWYNSNRQVMTVFNRCKATGLVSLDLVNGWMWKKAHPIGNSEPMAIDYMTNNPSLLMSMDNESKAADLAYDKFATAEEKKAASSSIIVKSTVQLSEQEDLMKRMKEKEEKLDALLKKAESANLGGRLSSTPPASEVLSPEFGDNAGSIPNIDVSSKKVGASPELRALQDDARSRGMIHAYTIKDENKLKEYIANNEKK